MNRLFYLGTLISFVTLIACGSPIVGSECREGLQECSGRCVDLQTEYVHCGICSNVCSGNEMCMSGICVAPDANVVTRDAMTDMTLPMPGPPPPCRLGLLECFGGCIDPASDANNCGSCGNRCNGVCSNGECSNSCSATMCDGRCVDTQDSLEHCGGCNQPCETTCDTGICGAAETGSVVTIGHDYRTSRVQMDQVLANATLLPTREPIRIVSYEGGSLATSRVNVMTKTLAAVNAAGRTATWISAGRVSLNERLLEADLLVINSQHAATDDSLQELGELWSLALPHFMRRGGIILLLDAGGDHAGTFQVLGSLTTTTSRSVADQASLSVVGPGEALGAGVSSPYTAEPSSSFFTTDGTPVVAHPEGPVVFFEAVTP